MTLPDPHTDEPTVQLDPTKVIAWREAASSAALWQKEVDRLKAELIADLGEAHAGTVDGVKVVYYRPESRWAEAKLRSDYPDLVQHFMVPRAGVEFDLAKFRQQHPAIAGLYQVRSFKAAG